MLLAASCKKDFLPEQQQGPGGINSAKVYKRPSSPEEIQLVENIKKVTEVLKELYRDKSNLKVVNASIFSKAYTDESILLRDLIYPENSRLLSNKKFNDYTRKFKVSLSSFATNFWSTVNQKNDPSFKSFLEALKHVNSNNSSSRLSDYYYGDDLSIYFPYSENFVVPDGENYGPVTALSAATEDAEEGWGAVPYYDASGNMTYVQVLINDEYCYNNPTQIVGVNGIEAEQENLQDPPPPPPPPPGVSRVYVGEGLCKNQYDRLISFSGNGGGSEVKYCHLTGYLQPVNGQVTTFQDIAAKDFTRKAISDKRWDRIYSTWDDDWVPGDLEQVFAIYEEDNTGTVTFNGSLSTTVTVSPGNTGTGSIGFSISRQSQDEIIRQLKISRNSYFAGVFQDQAWGFRPDYTFLPPPETHGWPKYDANENGGANVGWTWPYNTY